MHVNTTKAFLRALRKLSKQDQDDTIQALQKFLINPRAPELNFEPVKTRKSYNTIRSNYSVRVLLRRIEDDHYEIVAVGNHDYIYASYFKK